MHKALHQTGSVAAQSNMLQAALSYADLGYPVFPCAPRRKTPLTSHGLNDATTDRDQIKRWWTQHPEANIGLRTHGLTVIDIDGADNTWLTDQGLLGNNLTTAPRSRTPRGGFHCIFRQPEGKEWRNTVNKLAPHVDTRTVGGYIVVPPSVGNLGRYEWIEGHELDQPLHRLAAPPEWLVKQLDGLASKLPASRANELTKHIHEGERNSTLTSLAGGMRRIGMSQNEIGAALQVVNQFRCRPPLERFEVDQISASITRYDPARIGSTIPVQDAFQLVMPTQASIGELTKKYSSLREPVIHGLLRRGETMNIIAPSKTGKSWLVMDLALSIASGGIWLDTYQAERGNVLIIDNELHEETIAHRIPLVATARKIPAHHYADHLFVAALRGQLRDLFSLKPFFDAIEPNRYRVIILDAFYRFMPAEMDENDNGKMASLYNYLDFYADRLGCCFVLIHHTTKGKQAGKSVTDVGAGAGSQSRATDTHLILRAHQESDVVVLEAVVRSWPPVQPCCLRWEFPIWTLASDRDSAQLRGEKAKQIKIKDMRAEEFAAAFINQQPQIREAIVSAAKGMEIAEQRAVKLLREAEGSKLICR